MSGRADAFTADYGWVADLVAGGTGIDRTALLIQWAVETAFGTEVNNRNNLGNIRCLVEYPCSGGFTQFPNLPAFASAAVATWRNGYYPDVLAAAGQPLDVQLRAIGASPWDAGHYNDGGGPGSSLLAIMPEFSAPAPAPVVRGGNRMGYYSKSTRSLDTFDAEGYHGTPGPYPARDWWLSGRTYGGAVPPSIVYYDSTGTAHPVAPNVDPSGRFECKPPSDGSWSVEVEATGLPFTANTYDEPRPA